MRMGLLLLTLLMSFAAGVAILVAVEVAQAVDFVGPTLNKAIVITPGQTYTVPLPRGSGTVYMYPEKPCQGDRDVPGYLLHWLRERENK